VPTPPFILALREHVGHGMLWLTGVTAVVVRGAGDGREGGVRAGDAGEGAAGGGAPREVLLVRRADTGAWTPVTGIIDPGEQPAAAGAREVLEETDVTARPVRLVSVSTLPPMTYPNGDEARYLDLTFLFAWVSGEPSPADGENTEAAWFPVDALPPLDPEMRRRIDVALSGRAEAHFEA